MRWLGLVLLWAALTAVLYVHSAAFRTNVQLNNSVGLRGAVVSPTPLQRVAPTMYADAFMWVRHALGLAEEGGVRVRYTHVDNAPFGREVHWNSGFEWLILLGGKVRQVFTGEPFTVALEESLAWFNLPLLLSLIVVVSTWASRRAGLAAAVLLAVSMVGNEEFHGGFGPNYVDHHGLLAVSVLVLVLGGVFMGTGFWKTAQSSAQLLPSSLAVARAGAIASAVAGGLGLWISAATLTPAIAIVGAAGVAAAFLHGPRAMATGVVCVPDLWRLWGRTGALISFALYLFEYAPSHFGLRLEVNHPAYGLAWWGGSEIVAQLVAWRCLGQRPDLRSQRLLLAVAGIAVAPTIILLGGQKTFVVLDPFIGGLTRHVAEGISLPVAIKFFGGERYIGQFVWMGVSLLAGFVAWWRTKSGDRILVAFTLFASFAFTGMAVSRLRWAASASGPQIILIMIAIAAIGGKRGAVFRWASVAVMVLGLCAPQISMRIGRLQAANRARAVDKTDAMQPVYRDIARTLRAAQPEGKIVLLASPNASVSISYYGRFEAVGTLYWENVAGMKAAAAMFSAQTETEARRLIRERGVTHIALVSEDNFQAEYFNLLHPTPDGTSLERSFGYKALVNLSSPLWVEQIPYELPNDLPFRPNRVLLFKTRFAGSEADSIYEDALKAADANQPAEAEAKIERALALAPAMVEAWVAKTNLLMARGAYKEAFQAVEHAVQSSEGLQRATVCRGEAVRFYKVRAHDAAALLYRAALEVTPDPATANNLAWILATSPSDTVRNGEDALKLTTQLITLKRDPLYLSAHAAALAERGRFEDAVTVATEALAMYREQKDAAAQSLAEARLAKYRAGEPWRE